MGSINMDGSHLKGPVERRKKYQDTTFDKT